MASYPFVSFCFCPAKFLGLPGSDEYLWPPGVFPRIVLCSILVGFALMRWNGNHWPVVSAILNLRGRSNWNWGKNRRWKSTRFQYQFARQLKLPRPKSKSRTSKSTLANLMTANTSSSKDAARRALNRNLFTSCHFGIHFWTLSLRGGKDTDGILFTSGHHPCTGNMISFRFCYFYAELFFRRTLLFIFAVNGHVRWILLLDLVGWFLKTIFTSCKV